MLLFSKKARQVDYKPCTLKEYRESKPTGYVELGKLQPDLYTDELVAKVKSRAGLFSKQTYWSCTFAVLMSPLPYRASSKKAGVVSAQKTFQEHAHIAYSG